AGASDPIKDFDLRLLRKGRNAQTLRPGGPLIEADAPRVAIVLDVAQARLSLLGEFSAHEDEIAPHVHNPFHEFDKDRTGLFAGPAGRTGPENVRVDDLRDKGL